MVAACLGTVVHANNPNYSEAEAGDLSLRPAWAIQRDSQKQNKTKLKFKKYRKSLA